MTPDTLAYAELFAGAGGMSLGLEAGGFHALAHAEIEPHARAVLRYHWPDTRLDGDVTQIDGADYAGITLLSGGSPCQDLSVAGKRAGLAGGRSGLFREQCRIWKKSGAPYLLWENVAGAFSSNGGKDFATVLSTLVGATIAVPRDGWKRGGVASGPAAVAAWRVLDLQHFGPPQRRVRVFVLAARAGGVDPAEVLALSEGVCGHPSPREQQREGAPARAGGGAPSGSSVTPLQEVGKRTGVSTTDPRAGIGIGQEGDPMFTLQAAAQHGVVTLAIDDEKNASHELMGTLKARAKSGGRREGVLAFHPTQDPISGDVAPSFGRTTDGMGVVSAGRPRRLTPRECERLMSWPDDWTRYGIDEKGRTYELSDTARYRLCGNGVGTPCAEWIARRLADAIRTQNGLQSREAA